MLRISILLDYCMNLIYSRIYMCIKKTVSHFKLLQFRYRYTAIIYMCMKKNSFMIQKITIMESI